MLEKKSSISLLICFLTTTLLLTGCIRLWGGATYVKDKPGEYVEKTYILDTARIGEDKQVKGSIQ